MLRDGMLGGRGGCTSGGRLLINICAAKFLNAWRRRFKLPAISIFKHHLPAPPNQHKHEQAPTSQQPPNRCQHPLDRQQPPTDDSIRPTASNPPTDAPPTLQARPAPPGCRAPCLPRIRPAAALRRTENPRRLAVRGPRPSPLDRVLGRCSLVGAGQGGHLEQGRNGVGGAHRPRQVGRELGRCSPLGGRAQATSKAWSVTS